MKKLLYLGLLLSIVTFIQCSPTVIEKTTTPTLLIDFDQLIKTKNQLKENDLEIKPAFDKLIEQAEAALLEGPFSVTHKEKLPPSGDRHDYASYSRYWWPDPSKVNGLPYIRKDGETNPYSQKSSDSDRPRIGAFASNTETLGLAYFFTGEKKYADKVAELLSVWFLEEATRMNPNVNHAQCRPGHNNGSKSGVLDGRLLVSALESSLLIADSSSLDQEDYKNLKAWAKEYFNWLTSNEMALEESKSKNNHGSYYDAQAMYFALYCGNLEAAQGIALGFIQNRLHNQIEADGSMPEELKRTRPLFYSIYNLHAMTLVAQLAKKVDVDVWNSTEKKSKLKAAIDYLLPYTDPNIAWPHPSIGDADRMELYPLLKLFNQEYPREVYLKLAEKLPIEKRIIHRSNIAYPLMR